MKLVVAKLVKKFPTIFGTRMFIALFTASRHYTLCGTLLHTSRNSL